jgi:hypothetical protein
MPDEEAIRLGFRRLSVDYVTKFKLAASFASLREKY